MNGSPSGAVTVSALLMMVSLEVGGAGAPGLGGGGVLVQERVEISELALLDEAVAVDPGDRKSTRLNSSHVAISYAVFCLKKKKQIMKNTLTTNTSDTPCRTRSGVVGGNSGSQDNHSKKGTSSNRQINESLMEVYN